MCCLLPQCKFKSAANTLIHGFSEGFKLGYSGNREARDAKNLISINQNLEAAIEKINKEDVIFLNQNTLSFHLNLDFSTCSMNGSEFQLGVRARQDLEII